MVSVRVVLKMAQLGLLLLAGCSTLGLAVDRTKFRTCQQTSFCRRHRDNHSSRIYKYQLLADSVHFHIPVKEEEEEGAQAAPAQEEKADSEKGGVLKSLQRRLFRETDGSASKSNTKDPYVRGPLPTLTGTIANTAKETSSGAANEQLQFSIVAMADGLLRMRVTEDYGVPGSAFERARVTYDSLVLEQPENLSPAEHAVWIRPQDIRQQAGAVWKHFSTNDRTASPENFMALQYGDVPDAPGMLLLIRLQPFSVYLYRETDVEAGPILVMGADDMMHFEIRRFKDQRDGVKQKAEEEAKEGADQEQGKDTENEQEKKEEKEIVGYWEDGLAIYADGTREEKKVEDVEADHRQLSEEDIKQLDREGLWEEKFSSHTDSKPFGPMSVGMDIKFPNSRHLYGIPEHAAAATLQTTQGEGAHFEEPYRLYNLDVFEYELDETMALYGHVPLIVSQSSTTGTTGVFYFNPSETFVDVIQEDSKTTSTHWLSESGVIDIFMMPGPDPQSLYKQYAKLTGVAPIPPMFSLGYHQCRWNYKDEKDVYDVHGNFEELDYPYDVLWLDIEHTDGKRYFTWDKGLFPNPVSMQEKLAKQGRRMVTIVDPHIKRDNNYYIHKEATSKGLYIKDKDGKNDYDGWCWPGSSSYLDFTDNNVRSWWADQFHYKRYVGSSPTLFTWNDMNEPSVFNGPEVSMQKDLKNLNGEEHREWHNLYGMLFQRATSEGLVRRNQPDENIRPFVLSRAFFAGSQRYGAIWTGDNKADWESLVIAAPMLLSMNVAALSFVGADVGGFFGDPDAELFTRWMQAGAYTPFFRGHAHHDSKRREPWLFGDETLVRLRRASMQRYALLPFWYTLFDEAETTGMPVMRMMWMHYPKTEGLFAVDDQYLVGSDLLVKPVTAKSVTESVVKFPLDDLWYDAESLVLVSSTITPNGIEEKTVPSDIDTIPVYQRGGSIIPRKLRLRRSTMMMKADPYTLYVALDSAKKATGNLYIDDEESFDYKRKHEFAKATFTADLSGPSGILSSSVFVGSGWSDSIQHLSSEKKIERIIIMGLTKQPRSISLDGNDLEFNFVSDSSIVIIRQPELSALKEWKLIISQ